MQLFFSLNISLNIFGTLKNLLISQINITIIITHCRLQRVSAYLGTFLSARAKCINS